MNNKNKYSYEFSPDIIYALRHHIKSENMIRQYELHDNPGRIKKGDALVWKDRKVTKFKRKQ